jgi:hypothetical protein
MREGREDVGCCVCHICNLAPLLDTVGLLAN